MSDTFVRYDDPRVEPKISDESALQQEIRDLITRVQHHNLSLHRHGFRGTHVKTQGILKGTFTAQKDLPSHLAVGICSPSNASTPHPVAIRFANEPSFLTSDTSPGPRGCGLKIFNIKGDFMHPTGSATQTQDLTFNNAPVLELTDLPTTVEIFRIRERNFRQPEKIADEVSQRPDKELQLAPSKLPNQHFLSYTMYSQSAYRWGDCVVKYALFPSEAMLKKVEGMDVTEDSDPEVLSTWLREYFRDNNAEYDLRVQVCKDIEAQSVENTGMEWSEDRYPFETVGKVVLPKGQDPFSAKRRAAWDDGMRLNVWYGLEEHRPLGSANRLRKELYETSSRNREEMNARTPKDIRSIDEIPE